MWISEEVADCQRIFKINKKICKIISLGTTVNTERKRNVPKQDNKNAEILVWTNIPEKKLLQI